MREIKFRVWNINTHAYIDHESISYTTVNNLIDGLSIKNSEYIYLQYTGLKDKNGKEIYEGDIVEDYIGGLCAVRYDVGDAGYYPFSKPSDGGYEWDATDADTSEVIGNIYENPELLK